MTQNLVLMSAGCLKKCIHILFMNALLYDQIKNTNNGELMNQAPKLSAQLILD